MQQPRWVAQPVALLRGRRSPTHGACCRARPHAAQSQAADVPPRETFAENWGIFESLLHVEERQLRTAADFVAQAKRFSEQPLLWVGAPVRVEDAASFNPLPEWTERFRTKCLWPKYNYGQAP